ncbi:MAG: cation-translocating P-type ATPase C-terminal domain-containing protein, partial [Clostridiales bacterium]
TIHMPIALASLLAPMMSIPPEALLLLPLHVVLLELIIDPTCSIVLERQPAERDIMARPPRNPRQKMLTLGLLSKSVLQGLVIFAASFGMYYLTLAGDSGNAATARTMGLAVIMLANLFLVQVNSSDYDFACQCLRRLLKDKVMWSVNIGTIVGLLVIVYSPVASFLKLAPLSLGQLAQVVAVAAVAVLWYELVKAARKIHARQAHEN